MKRLGIIVMSVVLGTLTSTSPGFAATLALVGGKVYPSPTAPPIESGTILMREGRIYAVGPSARIKPPRGATIIDCRGLVVTAGFLNSHVHILTQGLMNAESLPSDQISSQLEEMFTRWGFTTVFDVASVLHNTNVIRRRIDNGEVHGPRIFTVGDPFYPKGGTPVYIKSFLEANNVPSAEVSIPAEAVARVRRQIANRADGTKIFAASFAGGGRILPMPLNIAKAIALESHRAGKPVFAHPSNMEGIEIALQSGVDVLVHTAPLAGPWSRSLIHRMRANHMALVPTLTLFEVEGGKEGASPADIQKVLNTSIGQLKSYSEAGGQILFGTDVGYIDYFDTAEELRLMARSGLSFQQILASLTTAPARRFRSRRDGRVAKGMKADLVVLDADPAGDITSFAKVHYTIRAGKVIYAKR